MSEPRSEWTQDIATIFEGNARDLGRAFANALRPPPRVTVSEWAKEFRHFPDGDAYEGRWRHETAPYLVEIMDALSTHDPCEEVAIKKCSQSGGSASSENWLGYIADVAPGPVLFVQGSLKAALDWAAEKFWPMVEATPKLSPEKGGAIKAQGLADGTGSTKTKVKFSRSNGYILLAGSNSAASLRQRTVRYAVEDDLDQFPDDLDGQGSPETMVSSRLKVYKRRGLSKRLKISTPTVKGTSKIGRAYDRSDRREYHFKCPECGDRFRPQWDDVQWPDGEPEKAFMRAPCCGGVIEHWQKPAISLFDGWLSREIGGVETPRHCSEEEFQRLRAAMPKSILRGFWIPGWISSFQTWAYMAQSFVDALGDDNRMMGWTNLEKGDEFEIRGDTPDSERLKKLAEGWGRDQVPDGVLLTVMGVDVQGDGLYYEKVGFARNDESWSLDAGFIPGATDVAGEGAWAALNEMVLRGVTYPGGKVLPIDQICVDGGYNTTAAKAFCDGRDNRLVVFGRAGWTLPILGRGEAIAYDKNGKRAGRASENPDDKSFIVGTYQAKLKFYGHLRNTLRWDDDPNRDQTETPRGLCHFGADAPGEYYEQITSETVVTKFKNGVPRKEWARLPGRQNHWLDCRVYAHAATEQLLVHTLTEADWEQMRIDRYAPPPLPNAQTPPQNAPESVKSFIDPEESWL